MIDKVSFVDEASMTVDDLAGICIKEFEKTEKRSDNIEKRLDDIQAIMVTRPEVDSIYRGMLARFDDMDVRFNRLEDKMDRKFDDVISRIDSVLITLQDHDKRTGKLEHRKKHTKS